MIENNITQLINVIFQLNGNKIITLMNIKEEQAWQYIFEENNKETHNMQCTKLLFKAKLLNAIHDGGSIIIRQVTKLRDKNIPIEKIYGIVLGDNDWFPITVQEMEIAHCTDAETREKIPKEKRCGILFVRKT